MSTIIPLAAFILVAVSCANVQNPTPDDESSHQEDVLGF
jgi:hypothetical protein